LKKTKREKSIAPTVNSKVAANLKEKAEADIGDESKAYIMSLVKYQVDNAATVGSTTTVTRPKVTPGSSFLNNIPGRPKMGLTNLTPKEANKHPKGAEQSHSKEDP